MVRKN